MSDAQERLCLMLVKNAGISAIGWDVCAVCSAVNVMIKENEIAQISDFDQKWKLRTWMCCTIRVASKKMDEKHSRSVSIILSVS